MSDNIGARPSDQLADRVEALVRRDYSFQPPITAVLRRHYPTGLTGHDWDDRDAFDRILELLALIPQCAAALRASPNPSISSQGS